METAAQMLALALPQGCHTERLCSFLVQQSEYKVVSADQWLGFLRFSQEVRHHPCNTWDPCVAPWSRV